MYELISHGCLVDLYFNLPLHLEGNASTSTGSQNEPTNTPNKTLTKIQKLHIMSLETGDHVPP